MVSIWLAIHPVRKFCTLPVLVLLAGQGHAQGTAELGNWFNDPFFQVSSAVPGCPVPLGPLLTQEERRTQAHHRAEKGTSCWLSGQCGRPNYYAYDQDIAAAFKSHAASSPALLAQTSLWVTVQGRVVFIEGCASRLSAAPELEAFARQLPHVQQAVALVRSGPVEVVPYKVRPGP